VILRFLPLGLIALAVICVAAAAILPMSRTKGQVRLAGSLSIGAAFAAGSLLSTTGQSWQHGVGVAMGASRKETFLDSLHPRHAEFAQLSAQEEELGLLSRSDIGTRNRWEALLKESHVDIVGHTLIRISEDGASEAQS
jgi:hypothetical protein